MELIIIAVLATWALVEQTDSGYKAMTDRMDKDRGDFKPTWTEQEIQQ